MKTLTLLSICCLLVGCSSEPEPSPNKESSKTYIEKEKPIQAEIEEKVHKNCTVASSQNTDLCTIYVLDCEDSSREYAVICWFRPMGEITNPPRPI